MLPKENDIIYQLAEYMSNAVAILIPEPEQKIIYLNPAWCNLMGYSCEEAYQIDLMQVIHPDMREMVCLMEEN